MSWWRVRSNEPRTVPANAEEWVVRMRAGALSKRDRQAVRRWMDTAPENARELLRAEAAWRLSGSLANDRALEAELADLDDVMTSAPHGRRRFPLRWSYLTTMVIAALAIGIGLWLTLTPGAYETAQGEQRVVTLADGSVIALNTATRLEVELSEQARTIHLLRGEALFRVTHDATRPFIVRAGHGYARALGTRFNVLAQEDTVTVSVLDGRVEVSPREASSRGLAPEAPKVPEPALTVLRVGESTAYTHDGRLIAPEATRASAERIVAWSEGKLRFDSWRLERAVREYNRYASKPVRLESEDLANVEITGVFRIGDSAAFVAAIGELTGARVAETRDALVLEKLH